MKVKITNSIVQAAESKAKPYEIRDALLPGFLMRVYPSGKVSYICQYARGQKMTIGSKELFTPAQAREEARKILSEYALTGEVASRTNKIIDSDVTLEEFLNDQYDPWYKYTYRAGEENTAAIKFLFSEFLNLTLPSITESMLIEWRNKRQRVVTKQDKLISKQTINRDISRLKALFNKAVEWGVIQSNPMSKIKLLRCETDTVVRFLSEDEEMRIRQQLDLREQELINARYSHNQFLSERGYAVKPDLSAVSFADFLKPLVLLALNTGMRKGELLSLCWKHINFEQKLITINSHNNKSKKTKYIYLNAESSEVLFKWYEQSSDKYGYVFPGKDGKKKDNFRKAWTALLGKANVHNFRWHDTRHHFASKLVMRGVEINTVRELLGHADIKTTMRYAHLAASHKFDAVAKLCS